MNVVRRDTSDQKRRDPCLHRAIQGKVASFYENAQFVGPGCVLRTDQDRIDNTVHRPDLLLDRVRAELEAAEIDHVIGPSQQSELTRLRHETEVALEEPTTAKCAFVSVSFHR